MCCLLNLCMCDVTSSRIKPDFDTETNDDEVGVIKEENKPRGARRVLVLKDPKGS